jgi:hypothetical protein
VLKALLRISIDLIQGLVPEIVPSRFEEDLPKSQFPNIYEYPVATATEKVSQNFEVNKIRLSGNSYLFLIPVGCRSL